MMTSKEFLDKVRDIEKNYKTVYAYGMFGAPITEQAIATKAKQYPNWYTAARQRALRALIGKGYFGFDCVNLFKGVLWGWTGDPKHATGGAKYNSNGVPDVSADGMIARSPFTSTDFSGIQPGDFVWVKGHIGVYIGDGLAIECTPKWSNDVQITAVGNLGSKPGYNTRTWTKWGKNPYIKYGGDDMSNYVRYGVLLKQGAKGSNVKKLQEDLIALGYGTYMHPYEADSSFGPATLKAVRAFQKDNGLAVDGAVGPATQRKIAELLSQDTKYKKLYEDTLKKLKAAEAKIQNAKKALS